MRFRFYILFIPFVAALYGIDYILSEFINEYVVRIIMNCGIACILAMSLNLVNGCAGQFSLGHAGFMAVGAYAAATLTTVYPAGPLLQSNLGVGFSVLIGGIAAGLTGYLVGLPSLRLRGDYLAIVTLGFGEIIRILILNIEAVGGARGLPSIPRISSFFWIYVWVSITAVVLFRIMRSSVGRALLSLREDEIAAESMGINTSKYKVQAFVISSFFAGIAGGLFAHYQGFIDPSSFSFSRSVEIVIMVVMGGMGSISGSVIGAIIVTVLPEFLRFLEKFRMVVFPAILIVLMLLRPLGLLGHHEIWHFVKKVRRPLKKTAT